MTKARDEILHQDGHPVLGHPAYTFIFKGRRIYNVLRAVVFTWWIMTDYCFL